VPTFAVLLTSAAGMALELAFARSAGPFLGTSTEVWSAVIAVTLAALAAGAWAGGTLADRLASPERALAPAVGLAALFAGVTAVARDQMAALGLASAAVSGSLFTGAAVAALLAIAPATLAIGAISPLAAKISLASIGRTGRTMGRLGAAGAGGSVLGTVLTGAVALPSIGTGATFAATTFALAVGAAILSLAPRRLVGRAATVVAAAGALLALGATAAPLPSIYAADTDTRYSRVLIERGHDSGGREILAVITDPFGVQCAGYADESPNAATSSLPIPYTRWLGLAAELSTAKQKTALVIGGCNLSFPRHLAARGHLVDVFEIDPGMTDLARQFFGATDSPLVRVTHGDARPLLERSSEKYGSAALDAFGGAATTPYHLVTEEFFASLRERMAPDSAVSVNVIGARAGESAKISSAILASAKKAFARVEILYAAGVPASQTQNILLLAWEGEGPTATALAKAAAAHGLSVANAEEIAAMPKEEPLSDDRSPIEDLASPIIEERLRQIAESIAGR
jgi:predicted membrane-bound spermidine synthase